MLTGSRANVNNLISSIHCLFIVFNYQQRISQITQMLQCLE